MKIIFVVGIKTFDFQTKGWRHDLPEAFPSDEIVFIDDFYFHIEHKKIEKIVEKIVKTLNTKETILLLAHSFGGILSKTAIKRLEGKHKILFCTMASPHQMTYAGVAEARASLRTPTKVKSRNLTFGGYFDSIVPYKFTSMNNSKHENFFCGHMAFLLSSSVRQKVITKIKKQLEKKIKLRHG